MSMLDHVERFATNYQHTVTLLGVLGTFSAVVVSLVLAWRAARANRTRLEATASMRFIIHTMVEDKNNPPTYLVVAITNNGNLPLRIPFSFFFWKFPLKRGVMLVTPLDFSGDRWIQNRKYPVEIAARASETFYLSDGATVRSEAKRMLVGSSILDRLRCRFLWAGVQTDDGVTIRVKLSKDIREIWRQARGQEAPPKKRGVSN